MADMLKDGLAFLTSQLKAYASQTVTYARGYDSVEVQATFGQKLLKIDDGFGNIRMEWTDLDFCIPAADLHFGDLVTITPTRGDLIYILAGDQYETFEVMPFGGDAAWRWSDPHQSMYRIHAKHIGTEAYY